MNELSEVCSAEASKKEKEKLCDMKSRLSLRNEFNLLAASLDIDMNAGKIQKSKLSILCKALKRVKVLEENIFNFYLENCPNSASAFLCMQTLKSKFVKILEKEQNKKEEKPVKKKNRRSYVKKETCSKNVGKQLAVPGKNSKANVVKLLPFTEHNSPKTATSDMNPTVPCSTWISNSDILEFAAEVSVFETPNETVTLVDQTPKKTYKENNDPVMKNRKIKKPSENIELVSCSKVSDNSKNDIRILSDGFQSISNSIPLGNSCRKKLNYCCNTINIILDHSYSSTKLVMKMPNFSKTEASFGTTFSGEYQPKENMLSCSMHNKLFGSRKRETPLDACHNKENIDPKRSKRSRSKTGIQNNFVKQDKNDFEFATRNNCDLNVDNGNATFWQNYCGSACDNSHAIRNYAASSENLVKIEQVSNEIDDFTTFKQHYEEWSEYEHIYGGVHSVDIDWALSNNDL